MPKLKYRTKNWKQYNQHLINRGFIYSDVAIETALMVKKVFRLSLRALQGFMNSIMFRFKALFGDKLSLKHNNSQIAETMAAIRAMNKLTRIGMPETYKVA